MKEDDKTVDGQSFYSEALTGSGTINDDGTYGPPEPDPTVKRGGPAGEHTSPGGVKRPAGDELVPPAQRTPEAPQTTKRANQK